MLQPLRSNQARQPTSTTLPCPPPVGGLNRRDALADMDVRDAIILDNVFPERNYVTIRKGHSCHRTDMGAAVRTLMAYYAVNGEDELFAVANGKIWEVTDEGSAATEVASGFTSNDFQWTNFATAGGLFISAVNGVDSPQLYDGSVWAVASITSTGLTSSTLISVAAHKERLWYIQKDSTDLWYLPVKSITGHLTKFPLGSVFDMGGQIQAIGTLPHDTGTGLDDYFVIVTSEGEVAIYQGTDPASASTWALVGTYRTGNPIGRRCLANIIGDLVILTTDGVISVQSMIRYGREQQDEYAVTAKIQEAFNDAALAYRNNFGWQIYLYPEARYVIINVPEGEVMRQTQFVMNSISGAWCTFSGLNSNCFVEANHQLYFGGNDGCVYRAHHGYQDNGAAITGRIKTAFNYYQTPGSQKSFVMIRPIITSTGAPSFLMGLDVDFSDNPPTGSIAVAAQQAGARWEEADWDEGVWGGAETTTRFWQTVVGLGICAAIRMQILVSGQSCTINAFDVMFEPGTPL